jgi:hypothetical protein
MSTPTIHQPRPTGEPRLASVASWAVLVASFGLSATTWIALARVAGFTTTLSLPAFGVTLAMAWLMPVAVDGYVVVALVLWMSPVPAKVTAFARKNTYGAAGIGIVAQSAYHLLFTLSTTHQVWRVVLAAIVGALPPAVAGLAVHMRALIHRESSTHTSGAAAVSVTVPVSTPTATTPNPNSQPINTYAAPTIHAGPAAPNTEPSPLHDDPTGPAPTLDPAAAPVEVPTPAVVAARITPGRPTTGPTVPAAVTRSAAHAPRRSGPTSPTTPASTLAPPTTDSFVSASDAAHLALPIVAPDLLGRAAAVARQYRTEHGTPITAGQLAVRLKVTSEQAAQALTVLNLAPDSPSAPIPTVNGHRHEATR